MAGCHQTKLARGGMKTAQSQIPAMNISRLLLVSTLGLASAVAADDATDFPPKPPVQPLAARDEAKTFQLPKGYHLELVLSEPDIAEPVCMAFDGNGRLYVAEMRSYMRDVDGTD